MDIPSSRARHTCQELERFDLPDTRTIILSHIQFEETTYPYLTYRREAGVHRPKAMPITSLSRLARRNPPGLGPHSHVFGLAGQQLSVFAAPKW